MKSMLLPVWLRQGFLLSVAAGVAGIVSVAAQTPPAKAPVDPLLEYRSFAMQRDGNAARGAVLFADEQRVACTRCHTVDSKGGRAGPDLFSVGDQFSRSELIDAVLTPSARIAVGYGSTVVETRSGEEYEGVLKGATEAWIELMGGDGKPVRIATADIREQRGSNRSLMPEGLQAGLSRQEFDDLIEYLVGLKQPAKTLANFHGMPEVIPMLAHPVGVHPLLDADLQVPAVAGGPTLGLTWFGQIPGFPGRFLVAHQTGILWVVEKGAGPGTKSVFADFTSQTFSLRGPNGVLGLTFHPRFAENRRYYVKQQVFEDGKITTLLLEREMTPDFRHDSGKPARRLLRIPAVAEHHNGGCLQFGPDGFLYFGMGDSAPNFDPQGQAQDLRLLFGKMLRIDVEHRDPGLEYAIPSDNPFRGRGDARPEIWAYGLREPWRFSFDALTGELWVADLGQERGDEIDIVHPGQNYGWNVYEGFELFSNGHRREGEKYVAPIFAVRRSQGTSIIGGYVYRSDPHSSFYGVYIFGDHQAKRIWGLTQEHGSLQKVHQLATLPQLITAFTVDESGNVYVLGYQGMVYQLDFSGSRFDQVAPSPVSTQSQSPLGK